VPGKVPPEVEVKVKEQTTENGEAEVTDVLPAAAAPPLAEKAPDERPELQHPPTLKPHEAQYLKDARAFQEELDRPSGTGREQPRPVAPNGSAESTSTAAKVFEAQQWTTFAETLRRWGVGEEQTRRICRWLKGEPLAPKVTPTDRFLHVLSLVKYTMDQCVKTTEPRQNFTGYVISLWEKRTAVAGEHITTAKLGWTAAESSKPSLDPRAKWVQALVLEMCGMAGRDARPTGPSDGGAAKRTAILSAARR
jgi:hypothetical protein